MKTLLPTSTTLTSLLREPVGSDQNLGVGRQELRTTSVSSASFGCAWGGDGVLGEMPVKRNVMYM